MKYQSEQEVFWTEDFSDSYIQRNRSIQLLVSNIQFFSKIFSSTVKIESVLEYGANIGMNIMAMKKLLPSAKFSAVEINPNAKQHLESLGCENVYIESILNFSPKNKYDFVLSKGLLIHINPDFLEKAYKVIYEASDRYICLAEYYNPSPVSIPYRGHDNKLFKRDFCGEMLDAYPNLQLVDYGFSYHRDNHFPQDDITWFLLEKR
ncbi:pseudaminic acid biosynthesis-associated methylase [Candidiatus Paracoxiella cheracis]|uniref:pseudaminic acid biosynthesis-associated methylase n=1 Tax=Candidiatus Paracoxiella cheracis TaxID=3405120 RepID=UPI003BF48371